MPALKPVVVIGHGVWLELTCALIARQLRTAGISICALVLPEPVPEAQSLCLGPEWLALCTQLQCPPLQLLLQAKGHVSLGCQYQSDQKQWFVPFGFYGLQAGVSEFEQLLLASLAGDTHAMTISADQVSVAAQAAINQKFALAPDKRTDLQHAMAFGVQLDSAALMTYLHRHNLTTGVKYHSSTQLSLNSDATGCITRVELDQARTLPFSFVLDCRLTDNPPAVAPASMLLRFWADAPPDAATPCSFAMRTSWGWLSKHRLLKRNHWQSVVDTAKLDLAQVLAELQQKTGITQWQYQLTHMPSLELQPLQTNVLRCGMALAAVDQPLYSGFTALQFLLERWLQLLPVNSASLATATLFNAEWQHFQAEAQAYIRCHEHPLSTTQGQLFANTGRLLPPETDAIFPAQWFGLLLGLGLRPQSPSVLLAKRSTAELRDALGLVQQSIGRLVSGMPTYSDTLARWQGVR